ncbi:MAG: type II toxin-antitoxin system RelE/ParE family toxin [Phycisphaeraceae bacterium]|nr:type II toxin-antitoxin system RelE/ParE family toxin [Phycisphaeraceae bacterium]
MEVEFKTQELEYLYVTPLDEIKGKKAFGKEIVKQFKKKVDILISITNITQLRQFRSLNFEFLKGDRKGECSVRLNDQYRLIFEQRSKDKIVILLINEISKHYE